MSNQNEQPQDTVEPVERPAERPAERPVEKPVEKPAERQKNPKRVEAGKKGAAARKAKRLAAGAAETLEKQDQSIDKITRDIESPKITKITRDTHINVYKNYIPLCFVGIVGLGAYIYFSWRPTDKPADKAVNLTPATQKERDLFDF